ncbi:MAG: helix-turn-helix domain-containing protein [Parcubacteria group bacterium]|jgi:sugar-specific transcriptional regulator TrmB
MDILKILEKIGMREKRAEVYLACLEMGGATAYAVAKKVGLKRPTVYDILNQLMIEGLVYKSYKGTVKYYSPADPQKLVDSIAETESKLKSAMPILQNLYNSPKAKPLIRYFEGKNGIKEMVEDTLRTLKKGDEILAYVGQDVLKYFPVYMKDYVKRRAERGIRLRGIYKKEKDIMEYMKGNQEQLRVARVLDEKHFPVDNETNIYKNKVAIASYGQEMFGMIIESEEIARSQRAIFELAWRGSETISNF